MKKYLLIPVFLSAFISQSLVAQDQPGTPKKMRRVNEIGISGGYAFKSTPLPEGDYKPILIMVNLAHKFTRNEFSKSSFWINFEPQINPVSVDHKYTDMEYGLNIGMRYAYALFPNLMAYVMPGYGVYDITVQTERQANGYIFGINLPAGLNIKFNNGTALNFQYRFRHISNGGLKNPNLGINNNFLVFGVSQYLGSRK
jgi:hypothetical protein